MTTFSYSGRCSNTVFFAVLVSLIGVTTFNFACHLVSRFVFDDSSTALDNYVFHWILFATTIASGTVINLGTVIQIVNELRGRNAFVDFKYTECLMCGCLCLLLSQVHTEIFQLFDTKHTVTFNWYVRLASPLTTLMSFVSVSVFHFVNRRQRRRYDDEYDLNAVRLTRYTSPRRLVFVEGTACIGKTTACDESFDYAQYVDRLPLFESKGTIPHVQAVYELNLHADILSCAREFSAEMDGDKLVDRCPLSQLAYSLLFWLDGQREEPHTFAERFDEMVLRDTELVRAIKIASAKWFTAIERLFADRFRLHVVWYGSLAPTRTVARMLERGGLECADKTWNLLHYTYNQNHVFRRMYEITGIGSYLETELLDRETVLSDVTIAEDY